MNLEQARQRHRPAADVPPANPSPVSLPAEWRSTLRFMESFLAIFALHWDHEPKMRNLFICKRGILRFMESFLVLFHAWDPGASRDQMLLHLQQEFVPGLPSRRSAFHFIERLLSFSACTGTMNPIGQFRVAFATWNCPSTFCRSWNEAP